MFHDDYNFPVKRLALIMIDCNQFITSRCPRSTALCHPDYVDHCQMGPKVTQTFADCFPVCFMSVPLLAFNGSDWKVVEIIVVLFNMIRKYEFLENDLSRQCKRSNSTDYHLILDIIPILIKLFNLCLEIKTMSL